MVSACDYGASDDDVISMLAPIRSNPETLTALRCWAAAFTALGERLYEVQTRLNEMEVLVAQEIARN